MSARRTCEKCRKEYSADARVCVFCNAPNPQAKKAALTTGCAAGCGAILIGGFILSQLGLFQGRAPASRDPAEENRAVVATVCELGVKERLKSPATADFPFAHMTQVQHVGGNEYRLASYVASQNAFGAIVRTDFVCDVSGSGGDLSAWRLKDLNLKSR